MSLRGVQGLVPNLFLHNVRELLEGVSVVEEGGNLAELMELSLLNQSKLLPRIILDGVMILPRIGN
jgi:hypothetical protein